MASGKKKQKVPSEAEVAGQLVGAGVLGVVANIMKCVSDVMDVVERHHVDRMKAHTERLEHDQKVFAQTTERHEQQMYFEGKIVDHLVHLQDHRNDVGGGSKG